MPEITLKDLTLTLKANLGPFWGGSKQDQGPDTTRIF